VEVTYSLANSYKVPHPPTPISLCFLHANDSDLGLVSTKQCILRVGLIKEKIYVQSKMSNHCSDIQKLFSGIRDGSSNIMYKISYKQCKNKIKEHSSRKTAAIIAIQNC
jgi:hypothetical protein